MPKFDPYHHNAYELLILWINRAPGAFHVRDLGSALMDDIDQFELFRRLDTLVDAGFLEHYGKTRGWFIKASSELVEQDYVNANPVPIDIWLPFGLSDHVKIYSGSLLVFAGVPNMGKSTVMYNMIKENRHKGWAQHLFNSESDAGELRSRLNLFPDIGIDQWNFKAYERYENFHEVIQAGENCINYIDFLEVHDEFYKVGGLLKKIHNKLKGGIAIVALQKNPGSETGLGGYRTLEVTRLALSVEYQKAKVIKAKSPRSPDFNVNGRYCSFKIHNGYKLTSDNKWFNERDEPKV